MHAYIYTHIYLEEYMHGKYMCIYIPYARTGHSSALGALSLSRFQRHAVGTVQVPRTAWVCRRHFLSLEQSGRCMLSYKRIVLLLTHSLCHGFYQICLENTSVLGNKGHGSSTRTQDVWLDWHTWFF